MFHLTETAATAMRDAISAAGVQGLRLGVETGGCAGMKYRMALVKNAADDDIVIEQHGVRLFVEPAHEPHLKGMTVDFITDAKGAGFTFDNPNASKCACGKSFC
jgi:iron-sulfur cluster assembly accessory protein